MDYVVGKDSCDYPITIIVPFNKLNKIALLDTWEGD